MLQSVDAIFENGVLKPLQPLVLDPGARVRIQVESSAHKTADEILELAARVYAGLSSAEIEDVEEHQRRRALFVERAQP